MKAILLIDFVTKDRKKLKVGDTLILENGFFVSYKHKDLRFPRTWVVDNKSIFKVEKIVK